MESLNSILSVPEWERKAKMYSYALELIQRDLSHIYNQACMRSAYSKELDLFISSIEDVLHLYKK